MGLFGENRNEKIIRETYVLLWNSAERLKEGRALRENIEAVAAKMAWIERGQIERTADSLTKYGAALACMAAGLLGELPEFRDRPFLNVAVPREKEMAILQLFHNSEAGHIRHDVRDFDEQDDAVPSIRQILYKVVLEEK